MTTCYKLTNANGRTLNDTQWGPGVTHEAEPGDGPLCSRYWIHVCDDPRLAAIMNPIHATFVNSRLWECRVGGATLDDNGLKRGVKRCTTVREIPLPEIATEQCVAFAILSAAQAPQLADWLMWAERWWRGVDRSRAAAARAASVEWGSQAADWAASAAADRAADWAAANREASAKWVARAASRATECASVQADRKINWRDLIDLAMTVPVPK